MSDLGEQLLEGLGQALAYLDGEEVPGLRIRAVAAIPKEIDIADPIAEVRPIQTVNG